MFGRGRIKDAVRGDAKVLVLAPTAKGARQTGKRDVEYRLTLEVAVAGAAPCVVEHVAQVPHDKTSLVGTVVPVSVSASDPSRLRVLWDDVPSLADRALASAAAAQDGDAAGAAAALGFTLRDQ